MMDKQAAELISELKKVRQDLDTIKTDIATIAVNTTPADSDDTEPEAEPAGT